MGNSEVKILCPELSMCKKLYPKMNEFCKEKYNCCQEYCTTRVEVKELKEFYAGV